MKKILLLFISLLFVFGCVERPPTLIGFDSLLKLKYSKQDSLFYLLTDSNNKTPFKGYATLYFNKHKYNGETVPLGKEASDIRSFDIHFLDDGVVRFLQDHWLPYYELILDYSRWEDNLETTYYRPSRRIQTYKKGKLVEHMEYYYVAIMDEKTNLLIKNDSAWEKKRDFTDGSGSYMLRRDKISGERDSCWDIYGDTMQCSAQGWKINLHNLLEMSLFTGEDLLNTGGPLSDDDIPWNDGVNYTILFHIGYDPFYSPY